MRCDLRVHSWHSGRTALPVLEHVHPLDVYERRRGMAAVGGIDAHSLAHLARAASLVSERKAVP